VRVSENDPQARTVALITAGADGARELRQFEWQRGGVSEIEIRVLGRIRLVGRMGEEIHEDAAGIVDEIAKSLGNKNAVYVARSRMFELMEIVIEQRLFEWDFDGGGGLALVGCNSNGHDGYGFTPRGLFRIGAAGEDGEGAVELLGEHDASEFVRKSHGAEREFLVRALA
jgi:hypothetical protein